MSGHKSMNIFAVTAIKGEYAGATNVAAIMGNPISEHLHPRGTAGVINDWIAESRETSRIERLFSIGNNQRLKPSDDTPKNGLFGI